MDGIKMVELNAGPIIVRTTSFKGTAEEKVEDRLVQGTFKVSEEAYNQYVSQGITDPKEILQKLMNGDIPNLEDSNGDHNVSSK